MTNIINQLQKNETFRAILKTKKIGWREFKQYHFFGIKNIDSKTSICMGKYKGQYDYYICSMITKEGSSYEDNDIITDITK